MPAETVAEASRLKEFPGLVLGLSELAKNGFNSSTVSGLVDSIESGDPKLTDVHPTISGLLLVAENRLFLNTIAANNSELLLTRLLEQALGVPFENLFLAEPQRVQMGFTRDILVGGDKGLLSLARGQGVDSVRVTGVTAPGIAKVERTSVGGHYLTAHPLNVGATELTLELMVGERAYTLVVPVTVWEKQIDPAVLEFDQELTTLLSDGVNQLPSYYKEEILKSCSPIERTDLLKGVKFLRRESSFGFMLIKRVKSLTAYQRNILLLSIPGVGVRAAKKIIENVLYSAMDGNDFEGDADRAKRYGVKEGVRATDIQFGFAYAQVANRNIFQGLTAHLQPSMVARLIGITEIELLTSTDQAITHLRGMIKVAGPDKNKRFEEIHTKAVELKSQANQVEVDALVAQALPALVEQDAKRKETKVGRSVSVRFYIPRKMQEVRVTLRDEKGRIVSWKKVVGQSSIAVEFNGMPYDELTATATGIAENGDKVTFNKTTIPKAEKPVPIFYGPNVL